VGRRAGRSEGARISRVPCGSGDGVAVRRGRRRASWAAWRCSRPRPLLTRERRWGADTAQPLRAHRDSPAHVRCVHRPRPGRPAVPIADSTARPWHHASRRRCLFSGHVLPFCECIAVSKTGEPVNGPDEVDADEVRSRNLSLSGLDESLRASARRTRRSPLAATSTHRFACEVETKKLRARPPDGGPSDSASGWLRSGR